MKKNRIFVSYRNISNENGSNFELFLQLKNSVTEYEFITFPPSIMPNGTLFSPWDVATFVNETFSLMDRCQMFAIIENGYFSEDGDFNSMWTEAETCMWSYYGRGRTFNIHKNKSTNMNIVSQENNSFAIRQVPIVELNKAQKRLLKIASIDFEKMRYPGQPDYSWPYAKFMHHYILICEKCGKKYMSDSLRKTNNNFLSFECSCGHLFEIERKGKNWVCVQSKHSHGINRYDIFEVIGMMLNKFEGFEFVKLN